MHVVENTLNGVKLLKYNVFIDERGTFSETYSERSLRALGIDRRFVQDNQVCSSHAGTVRGLHFQASPTAQAKLVRVLRGKILDIVVDIRPNSPSFGRYAAFELSAENRLLLFVPETFAHGYCTLEPDTDVAYKVDAFYAPESERGILWNDPALGIPWPVKETDAIVSARDRALPNLAEWQQSIS
jgi:dTDP-4-dehydrorhamnose 3,5-epimerase